MRIQRPPVLPDSFASPSAIAYIATQKYVMYSPLYRLEQEFERMGLKLTRKTMSNWLLHATEDWLNPIYDVLHRQLCQHQVLHGDETTLQVLREKDKSATSKSYMWLYCTSGDAEHPIVLYEYQPNCKAEHAERFWRGSLAGSIRMTTRATTSYPHKFEWWAAGLIPDTSLTKH